MFSAEWPSFLRVFPRAKAGGNDPIATTNEGPATPLSEPLRLSEQHQTNEKPASPVSIVERPKDATPDGNHSELRNAIDVEEGEKGKANMSTTPRTSGQDQDDMKYPRQPVPTAEEDDRQRDTLPATTKDSQTEAIHRHDSQANENKIWAVWRDLRGLHSEYSALVEQRVALEGLQSAARVLRSTTRSLEMELLQLCLGVMQNRDPGQVLDLEKRAVELRDQWRAQDAAEKLQTEAENHILSQEFRIQKLETRIFDHREVPAGVIGSHYSLAETSEAAESVHRIGMRSLEDRHLLKLYGVRDMLEEQHHFVSEERNQLLDDSTTREALGLSLHPDSQEVLEELTAQQAALAHELSSVEEQIRLWQTRASDADSRKQASVAVTPSECSPEANQSELLGDGVTLDPSHFRQLLYSEPEKQAVFSNTHTTGRTSGIDKAKDINSWILHQARSSGTQLATLEAGILAALPQQTDVETAHLPRLAMDLWFEDDANRSFHYSYAQSEGELSFEPRRSKHTTSLPQHAATSGSPIAQPRGEKQLLQTNAETTSADVIAHALRTLAPPQLDSNSAPNSEPSPDFRGRGQTQ